MSYGITVGEMALINVQTLAGYLLEEALCHLLRRNGYRLLQAEADDPDALRDSGRGLLVKGRGAEHQADALGDLLVPSPFSLPVRLFVEAKNRRQKATLRDVRNAHGVITDVNEHYSMSQALSYQQPLRRYQYRYALFSASGFGQSAQGFALAQQISLVDLSGPSFAPLISSVNQAAAGLHSQAVGDRVTSLAVHDVRLALRAALERADAGEDLDMSPPTTDSTRNGGGPTRTRRVEPARRLADEYLSVWAAKFTAELNASLSGEGLIIGFPPAPFILALRPDNMTDLEEYVAAHGPEIPVNIGFDRETSVAGDWAVTPVSDPEGFRLTFGIPGALETWLLLGSDGGRQRAADAKRGLLSTISMFLEDRLVRLSFSPPEVPLPTDRERAREATSAGDDSALRRVLKAPPRRVRPPTVDVIHTGAVRQPSDPPKGSGWSTEAVQILMHRLREGEYVQADLIREAARRNGIIDRADVYSIAGFPRDRTLRGLTRPARRITAALINAGVLHSDAAYPFLARYANGVRATHFVVPKEVVEALRRLGPPDGI
jgi:hypothetical protein